MADSKEILTTHVEDLSSEVGKNPSRFQTEIREKYQIFPE